MIYTITLSPAIDYKVSIPSFDFNTTTHFTTTSLVAGGKGINVSLILNSFNIKNIALVTIGGLTKELFLQLLDDALPNLVIFLTKNNVRINIKAKSIKESLEMNDRTKIFSKDIQKQISIYLLKNLQKNDYVLFGGSPPTGISNDIFFELIKDVNVPINIIVDARKEFVIPLLKRGIFLLKPNIQELNDYSDGGKTINNKEINRIANHLMRKGVKNILVSMDKKGSILYNYKGFKSYHKISKKLKVIDTIGAGDSMISGFLMAHMKNLSLKECHRWAIASSFASITSMNLTNKKSFSFWLNEVNLN